MKAFFYILLVFFLNIHLFAADIAVVTLAVGEQYKDAVKTGIENKEYYCKKHGYDFYVCEEQLDPARPIPWSKILFVQKIMEEHSYKWIFWTDADSFIMNTNIKLEDRIDDDFNFIISQERYYVNSGQFLIKNCSWSENFLKTIYAHTEHINHKWWDQKAIIEEISNEKFKPFIKILPQRALNSYDKKVYGVTDLIDAYQEGDFILHFVGSRNIEALKLRMQMHEKNIIK